VRSTPIAGLVNVAAFLPDSVELVEEEHARCGAGIFKELRQASIGLPEISPDQCVIAHSQ
jgi:hypothetical protein